MALTNPPESAAENFHKKAEAYLTEKKFDEAIASCELAIKIEENYFPAYKTLGNAWQVQGKLAEAENWYKKALEIKSDWPEVYANLGSLYGMQQKWQEAVSYYQKAVSLKPDFAGAYRNMTKIWLGLGNQKSATYCQYKALSIEPEKATPDEFINLGKNLEKQESLNEAISCYRMAIKLDNNSSEAYQNLGEALKQGGKLEEATVCFRKAIELKAANTKIENSDDISSVSQYSLISSQELNPGDTLVGSLKNNRVNGNDTLVASEQINNMSPQQTLPTINIEDIETYIVVAETYVNQKKWEQAIAVSQKIISIKPEPKAYKIIGNSLQALGKLSEALDWYKKALEIKPDFGEVYANIGTIFAQQKQWEKAIQSYRRAIAIKPDFAGVYRNLAKIYTQVDRSTDAAEYLYQALRLEPGKATAEEFLFTGNNLNENGQLEQAIACYEEAIKLKPQLVEASYKLGEILIQNGQWGEAVVCYQRVISANPKNLEAYEKLGDGLLKQGQLYLALQNYQKAQQLEPNNTEFKQKVGEIYYRYGEVFQEQGKVEEAVKAYSQATENSPEFDIPYGKLGEIFSQQEKWEEAAKVYQKASEIKSDNSWYHNSLGEALKKLEKWEEAVTAYRKAIELNPNFSWSHNNLGDCLLKLEKWEEAVTAYRKAIELNPDFTWSYINLGNTLWEIGNWQEAIDPYSRAIELKADLPEAYQKLGDALKKRAELDLEESIKWYKKAIENNPDNEQLYHKALEVKPEDHKLYLQLGNTLVKKGKTHGAIAFYQLGLQINPDDTEIQEQLQKILPKKNHFREQGTGNREQKTVTLKSSTSPIVEKKEQEIRNREEVNFPISQLPSPTIEKKDSYQLWLKENLPNSDKLNKMSENLETFRYQPLISIILPEKKASPDIQETIESVINQIYPNWELHYIADKLPQNIEPENRIKLVLKRENQDIATDLNSALALATGDFITLLNPDDLLTPDALYQMALFLNKHPDADMIYSDEDKLTSQGKLTQPYFKPDWCPDSFLSRMYTGHLCIYRRELLEKLNGFRVGYESSYEYDLILRLTEVSQKIFHIPKVLYHNRISENPLEINQTISEETAKKALTQALARRGEIGKIYSVPNHPGFYQVRYQISDKKLVSIIIPTRNLGNILDRCLESIFTKTTYPNYEVIVIDNGSDEPETLSIIEEWKKKQPERFKSYELNIPFNFSKLNNFAVEKAEGDYLLFLNNDTEVKTADWLEAMVEQAQREKIGAVGALLLYPDNTIQHAGVVLGMRSVADHSHRGFSPTNAGYKGQIISINNYSAVTAACLMCRREVFEQIGGFDEELAVAFNDVDLCLKMLHKGYQNIYLPHAVLYHHESKSRGVENTGQKQLRFQKEIKDMKQRWKHLIDEDPCYNPHLTRQQEDFSLRIQTNVEVAVSMYEKDSEIVGCSIDVPLPGIKKDISSISIGGWVVGKKSPPVSVEFISGGKVIREVPANLHRPDVGEIHPEFPEAKYCGFWGEIEVIEFAPEIKISLEAILKDGSHVRVGMVNLKCPNLL
ncbi:MAG: tetratricopeptide repeat protein [Okeania sp. SIO2F4]|uniref:tetratricopeptide repeat protein n=1 Tax=Okeania sp. SIO2F4 TaxID=2607790 RepID=UPI00142C6E9F|nr:tetratricopeptide repeat protein [Okeania sp. SIO2F4]NES04402.1 tetratricopeptide repeat protein [Okeania sp. SIO2F4]